MEILDSQAQERMTRENWRCATGTDGFVLQMQKKSLTNSHKNPNTYKSSIAFEEAFDKDSIEASFKEEDGISISSVLNTTTPNDTQQTAFADISYTKCLSHNHSLVLEVIEQSDTSLNNNLQKDASDVEMHARINDVAMDMCIRDTKSGFDVMPIKFVDVTYSISINKSYSSLKHWTLYERKIEKKEILHGVTGYVLPGQLIALMGPSGSGKTTLINLLSGRKSATQGDITYNNSPYSKALKRRMGFVMQDDILHPHLTVLETLQYAALLRLPRSLSKADKLRRAMEVVSQLGLESCQNTIIGGPFLRGISGGERKRVSVGNEILTNPSLLFLDEPTSGLDSTIALRIVQILKEFSNVGRSVVTTIHQPSSRLFYMFDKLILLSEGNIIYFGEAQAAMEHFSSIKLYPLISMNPADFLLDLANGNLDDMSLPLELEHKISYARQDKVNLSPQFQGEARQYISHTYEKTLQPIERNRLSKLCISYKHREEISKNRKWSTSWWLQFKYLFMRGFKARRHEYLSWLRIVQVIASALIVGSLWLHSSTSTAKELADQIGLLFFMSTFWTFFPLMTAIFAFPQERAILAKERASSMYRLSAYFIARTLSDVLLELCLPLAFLIIVYFMASLQRSARAFLLTLLTVFLTTITAQGLGTAIGAALMDVKKATSLASVILLAFILAGGFFVQHLPLFIAWIRYVSINFYSFKLIVKIQYEKGQEYNCQISSSCESIAASPALYNIPLGGGGAEAAILISMVVGYHLTAYIFLSRMKLSV